VEEEAAPPPPLETAEVVFSSPYEGETDVPVASSVRIQFSRGIDPKSIDGQIRASYVGGPPEGAPPLEFQHTYDGGTRAIELKFAQPFERFRTLRIELLEGLKAFDGAPVKPTTITFSAGG
jgi:hypothetical protein